jgi:hypothetical protein
MTTNQRIALHCFLLEALLRYGLAIAFVLPIVAPLQASNLLASSRGDSRLFTQGATQLAAVWSKGAVELGHQSSVLLAVVLVGWLGKVVVNAIVFTSIMRRRSPFSRPTFVAALDLVIPFALLSLGLLTSITALVGSYVLHLQTIGAFLEPVLGDRGTDLTELVLLALLGVIAAGLVLIAELARVYLCLDESSLRFAIHTACQDFRYRTKTILVQAAPRALIAVTLQTLALYVHLCWHQRPAFSLAPQLSVVFVELSAAATIGLYLNWLYAIKRVCRSPDEDDGASTFGD